MFDRWELQFIWKLKLHFLRSPHFPDKSGQAVRDHKVCAKRSLRYARDDRVYVIARRYEVSTKQSLLIVIFGSLLLINRDEGFLFW